MKRTKAPDLRMDKRERQPHRVRLPGFIVEEDIGLGDALKRVTYRMGITSCAGCEKRDNELDPAAVMSRAVCALPWDAWSCPGGRRRLQSHRQYGEGRAVGKRG